MTTAAAAPEAWEAHDVTLPEVCRALARLRRQTDGPPMTLASILTLVAFAPRAEDVAEIEGVIRGLADHQPSRAVVVTAGRGGAPGIDARVATNRRPVGYDRCVWMELITLTLRGETREGIASAVVPLLRYDLPTFLWWPAAPDGNPDSPLVDLAGVADRLITEAGRGGDARRAVRRLAGWTRGAGPAATDLAWAAITPWRQLLVQLLDPPSLGRLRDRGGIAAVRHPGAEPTVGALLFAGWLVDSVGERLAVSLEPGGGAATGGLAAVRIALSAGRTMKIEAAPDQEAADVRVTEPDGRVRRRMLALPHRTRVNLLAGELEVQRPDDPFERAVPHAVRLAGA